MKIVVVNGRHEADFIIKKFKKDKHHLIVINKNQESAEYISTNNQIPVLCEDATKAYTLSDADADNADVLIALSADDIENYVTCLTAKRVFNVKRVVSLVQNPKRVDLFKELGIDSVICSTYLLGESIKNESIIETFTKKLSLENDKIMIAETLVDEDYAVANKMIKDIAFPPSINISCIYREPEVIIPNGSSIIKPGDKLIIVSSPEDQEMIIDFIHQKVDEDE
jgi:trk system potassium uptake protein TrkA